MFYKIYAFIRFTFWYLILRPIRKWINLCIHGYIIPDNQRNQEIKDYCIKCINDHSYKPSTPVEHYVDMKWREIYANQLKDCPNVTVTYDELRANIAFSIYTTMAEYANGKVA